MSTTTAEPRQGLVAEPLPLPSGWHYECENGRHILILRERTERISCCSLSDAAEVAARLCALEGAIAA